MATKKKTLFEEIELIDKKAKQLKEELKGAGLDGVVDEQEMAAISFRISNEILGAVR